MYLTWTSMGHEHGTFPQWVQVHFGWLPFETNGSYHLSFDWDSLALVEESALRDCFQDSGSVRVLLINLILHRLHRKVSILQWATRVCLQNGGSLEKCRPRRLHTKTDTYPYVAHFGIIAMSLTFSVPISLYTAWLRSQNAVSWELSHQESAKTRSQSSRWNLPW